MSQPLVAILGTRYEDFAIEEEILGVLGARIVSGDGDGPAQIHATAAQADVILAGSRPRFTADVLAGLRAKGIVRYGVGSETIDLDAARRAGIAVARVSDYGTEAVAFHAVGLALTQLRRIVDADRAVRAGNWGTASLRPLHLPSSLTAGVIGYGRIGRQVAAHFRGLGFRVCAFDAHVAVPAGDGVEGIALEQLLERCDVVSLHAPGSPDGRPLLDAPRLRAMKPGSVLVNTARGSLIDTAALIEGLAANRPGRAALDVFAQEPPDPAIFERVAERVVLTPHMAWYTEESETDLRRKAADEVVRLLRGQPLRDPVVATAHAAEPGATMPSADIRSAGGSLAELTGPETAEAIARSHTAVLPLGSIEQHGPHLPNGTDTMAAELIARAVAERLGAVYVPFGPYGVTPIHAGHPGTVNLRRATFEALLSDICSELIRMGVRIFVLVNWHEGNIASMDAVATDLQDRHDATFFAVQACYTAQRVYREDGGELTHGGGIETLAVLAHDPALARIDRAGGPTRPAGADAMDRMRRSREVYGFITDVSELADDGWYGNPGWATRERAEHFTRTVCDAVLASLDDAMKARDAGRDDH